MHLARSVEVEALAEASATANNVAILGGTHGR